MIHWFTSSQRQNSFLWVVFLTSDHCKTCNYHGLFRTFVIRIPVFKCNLENISACFWTKKAILSRRHKIQSHKIFFYFLYSYQERVIICYNTISIVSMYILWKYCYYRDKKLPIQLLLQSLFVRNWANK